MNQQIDNIHSFIFCKDFAPSMKLPLVNKLADFFLNLVLNVLLLFFDSCIIIIIIIIIVIVIVIIIAIFFTHTETSPLLQWPPLVCRHEPLTHQQKREGSQSMRFHSLR